MEQRDEEAKGRVEEEGPKRRVDGFDTLPVLVGSTSSNEYVRLGMRHGEHCSVDDSHRDEPILAVVESFVDHGRREPVEKRRHFDEVHSVLEEFAFRLASSHSKRTCVT